MAWTQKKCNLAFCFSEVSRWWNCRSKCTKLKQSGSDIHEVVESHTALPRFGEYCVAATAWYILRHLKLRSETIAGPYIKQIKDSETVFDCTRVLSQPIELCLQVSLKCCACILCCNVSARKPRVHPLPCCPCCNEVNKVSFSAYEYTRIAFLLSLHSCHFRDRVVGIVADFSCPFFVHYLPQCNLIAFFSLVSSTGVILVLS